MAKIALDSTAPRNGHKSVPVARAGIPLPTRQKRPGYVALAVVLIVGLALAGGYSYSQAGRKVPVVVVIQRVAAGHVIQRADVSTVDIAGEVTAIGGARMSSVVGETATVELLPNMLLQRSMVTDTPMLGADEAQVGVEVKPGQLPANGVQSGDTVEILQLPDRTAASSTGGGTAQPTATVLVADATVYDLTADPSQSGGMLLTVVVPRSVAAGIATASDASLIAVVRVGR